MSFKKFRWSKVYESSEEELLELLDIQGIEAERWSAPEFHEFKHVAFDEETTLWCAEGSLTLTVENTPISMQPGDAIRIPAHHAFSAVAGMSGCACYEAVVVQ